MIKLKSLLKETGPDITSTTTATQAKIDKLISTTSGQLTSYIDTNKITFEYKGSPYTIIGATLTSYPEANATSELGLTLKWTDNTWRPTLNFRLQAPDQVGGDLLIRWGGSANSVGPINRKNVYSALYADTGADGGAEFFGGYVENGNRDRKLKAEGKPNPLDQIVELLNLISAQWKTTGTATQKS